MAATGVGSPLAQGPVELVPSTRGGRKARYSGRTFTLETNNGMRYRWRCDVRLCRSRLTTDAYDDGHMVYTFRPHDEDVHRLDAAARKKRRSEATYKQEVTKIGDYGYVLENRVGSLLFWRCEYVSCPGRCRTDQDHRLVAGPSHHLNELHNQGGRPDTVGDVGDTSTATELDQPVSLELRLPGASENVQRTARVLPLNRQQIAVQEKSQHSVQARQEHEERQEHQREDCTTSTVMVQQEPTSEPNSPPPSTPVAETVADVSDVATGKDAEKCRSGTGQLASASGPIPNRSPGSPTPHVDSHLNCPTQPASQPSEVSAATKDTVYIVLSDSEEPDMDVAGDKNSVAGTDSDEADKKSSHKATDSFLTHQSHVTSSHRKVRLAEVLAMTDGGEREIREQDLRVAVLQEMRRLIEAETSLARERLQTEVLRGSLLKRHLEGFDVKKEPA